MKNEERAENQEQDCENGTCNCEPDIENDEVTPDMERESSDGKSTCYVEGDEGLPKIPWPDPAPEELDMAEFNAVWAVIKSWDINVPDVYSGYCGATGNHVRAILDALRALDPNFCPLKQM